MIKYNRLKEIREKYNLSQEEMAKIINVKRPAYSLWEIGISIIPLNHLCDFADYFSISLDYALGLTDIENEKELISGLDTSILGTNIKELRTKNKWSQAKLATKLNTTQPCIVKYEKGLGLISTSNLYKLSKLFNISINSLCGKYKN